MDFSQEPKVVRWKERIIESGCIINKLEPLQLIYKKNGELLFALLRTDITSEDGGRLPPIVMIRGDVVVVVPLVKNRDTGEERFLMVIQDRVGNGRGRVEFPAGMLDRAVDNPLDVAVRELKEETGIDIEKSELTPLNAKPLYTSPGLNDEAVNYFGCIIEVCSHEYLALEGSVAGAEDENETTVVTLRSADEIELETDAGQVLLGLYLFKRWRSCAE